MHVSELQQHIVSLPQYWQGENVPNQIPQEPLYLILAPTQLILHFEDNGDVYFKDKSIPWYAGNESRCTKITSEKFKSMGVEELDEAVYGGLRLEQITRITGYFTKVASWNKGKVGELKDRRRFDNV